MMNAEQKSKITQNLTFLKESLLDLDPVIDRLIENDVFKLEHRSQIEASGTQYRQLNEFIRILTSSPNKDAYITFIEALAAEKHFSLVEKLQNTTVKTAGHSRCNSVDGPQRERYLSTSSVVVSVSEDKSSDEYGASAAVEQSQKSPQVNDYTSNIKHLLEEFGSRQEEMIKTFERQQREDKKEFERQRLEDKRDMERRLREEKVEAERIRMQDKREHQEKLDLIWREWQEEKYDILRKNDETIEKLHMQITEIQKGDLEFKCLREKYDYLKQVQKGMREKDNERVERLRLRTKEKEELKKENIALRRENQHLKETTDSIREKREQEKWQLEEVSEEKQRIEKELQEKEEENNELQHKLEDQYRRLQELLQKQKQSSKVEDPAYVQSVEEQLKKLDAIYGMVQSIKDKPPDKVVSGARLEIRPRRLYPNPHGQKTGSTHWK